MDMDMDGRKEGTRGEKEEYYQFAATMGLVLRFSFLDLGLCFTFGMEDLFFFFWSSRPIMRTRMSWMCRLYGPVD